MKKIAIILSGCGNRDGSEITEVVSTLIALSNKNAQIHAFAPNQPFNSFNHLDGSINGERNILEEAARIMRGQVQDIIKLDPKAFDALVIPGGYGAALHLSNWAEKGHQCRVLPEVEKAILEFHKLQSPIGAICIAPALVARVLGSLSVSVTVGNDIETIDEIIKTGAVHEICNVDDFITDRENKVITTPAYMYDATPAQVFKGISGLVNELYEMA
jgi:enhancing lycopene biosynthesis protein 2